MNQTELVIAVGAGLFVAFLLGWLAGLLTSRAGRPAAPAADLAGSPAFQPDDRLAAAEDAASRARDDLRMAQLEIEELRSYIERKLAPRTAPPPQG